MNDPVALAASQRGQTGLLISESAFSATKIPVFHIVGSRDTTRLPESRHLKDKVLPVVEFKIVDGATHSGSTGLFTRPEFVDAISEFLGRHRAR